MKEPSHSKAVLERQQPLPRRPERPTRWPSTADAVAAFILAVFLCVMSVVSVVMGYVAMVSTLRCSGGDDQLFVCSSGGFDVTFGLLTFGGPLLSIGAIVTMMLVRRRKFLFGLLAVALLLLIWWAADAWTGGLKVIP